MKLLLFIILATFSLAGTTYQSSVFAVENKILYCSDIYENKIKQYNPGEILSGYYVIRNCSYNIETITTKHEEHIKKKKDKEQDKNLKYVLTATICIAIFLVYYLI